MIATYQDKMRKLQADNTKLMYQLRILYNYEDEGIIDEFEQSKRYDHANLISFNRLLNNKIRQLQQEKQWQDSKMIFDERPLDDIISGYAKGTDAIQDAGFGGSGTIKDFASMYKQYRQMKEKKADYIENTSALEQLKKLRKNA